MIRKRYFAIAGAALLLIVVVATILSRPSGVTTKGADGGSSPATASAAVYSTASYDQIDTGSLSREQISAELNRRDATDSKWEWKVPIQFFGRVVDENDRPIADAEVDVQWTDLTSRGTSERRLFSGANGSFEIHDITGKRLIVRVEKPGYAVATSTSPRSFEFANPFEDIYYRPDNTHPVTFKLRRLSGCALLHGMAQARVDHPGDTMKVPLSLGGGSETELIVQAWKPWPPRPQSPPYEWRVVLEVQHGGFVETREEVPFEAPESGYSQPVEIAMTPALGNNWQVEVDKTYYFHIDQPDRYGVLQLQTSGNSRYVFFDYRVNPTAGDRKVDFDPAKEIKAK